jgi:hypothetical protein
MLTYSEGRLGRRQGTGRSQRGRRRAGARARLVALVVMATGLAALAPQGASAASMYVHSAKSGELSGGRLVLRGVGRHVTWTRHSGDAGLLRIARLHRLVFAPGATPVTATLHIAGHRGGEELALRLSRPRYDTSRQTVSYRVKRLRKRRLSGRSNGTVGADPIRRFRSASLSLVSEDVACSVQITNNTGSTLLLFGASTTDASWEQSPGTTKTTTLNDGASTWWSTHNADGRCANAVDWQVVGTSGVFVLRTYQGAPLVHFECNYSPQGVVGGSDGPELACDRTGNGTWALKPAY